jgi:flagellar biosynthesis protein FlhF
MRLKLFRAATVPQAMSRVRAELGADALILATRRVAEGVEITAAIEPHAPAIAAAANRHLGMALTYHGVPATLAHRLDGPSLAATLTAQFRFAPLPLEPGARPILLAGPPGAGKTLTTARLATRLVMGGATPMVVTADGRRAGATEQLAAFTRLLGLNLVVASHPITLARAIASRRDDAPVLVDLPGSDPFHAQEREELMALATAADAHIVAVMPAGADPAEAADLAGAYCMAGAGLMVATRLDLARRIGGVLAAADAGLAIAEAGIGPGAADGLVPLTPELLARRLQTMPTDQRAEMLG